MFASIFAATRQLDQKLKVVQTWVFIQAILIVLLIAYTALLGVWLSPFFPMNYQDTTPEGNVITLSSLQSDVSKIEKSAHLSNDTVDYLHAWQKGHDDTHISLNKAVDDLMKRSQLDSKINEQVVELTKQNDQQKKEISTLQSKITDLERILNSIRFEGLDGHNIRIWKLESAKGNISSTLNQLVNSTKNQFCKVFKDLGNTTGRVKVIERQLTNEITQDVGVLQQDVDHLKTSMSDVTQDLNAVVSTQRINGIRIRDKFIEQDDLRGTALEKQRVIIFAKVAKVQCKLDELEGSLNDRIEHIMSNTTPGMQTDFDHKIKVTQMYFEDMISNFTDRVKKDIDLAESNFEDSIDDLKDSLSNETKDRTAQFVHVCDMVEGVNSNASQMFKSVEWEAFQNKKHVNDLIESVAYLEKAEAENSDNVASLNTTQQTQRLKFVQFQEETIHTGLDLTDRMCTVESGVQDLNTKTGKMDTRLGIAETTMQDIPIEVRGWVNAASAKTTENLAILKAENVELRSLVEMTADQLAQFAKDFGLGSVDSLQQALRSAAASDAPITVGLSGSFTFPEVNANMAMRDPSDAAEPVPPPLPAEEYEYEERE